MSGKSQDKCFETEILEKLLHKASSDTLTFYIISIFILCHHTYMDTINFGKGLVINIMIINIIIIISISLIILIAMMTVTIVCSAGFKHGDSVALFMENRPEYIGVRFITIITSSPFQTLSSLYP